MFDRITTLTKILNLIERCPLINSNILSNKIVVDLLNMIKKCDEENEELSRELTELERTNEYLTKMNKR